MAALRGSGTDDLDPVESKTVRVRLLRLRRSLISTSLYCYISVADTGLDLPAPRSQQACHVTTMWKTHDCNRKSMDEIDLHLHRVEYMDRYIGRDRRMEGQRKRSD